MKYLSALFIFLSIPAFGADIPKDTQVEILTDWSGGLNTASPPHKIGKNFTPNMRNVFVHRSPGQIIKRDGSIVLGSSNVLTRISYGFTFIHADNTKEFLVTDSSIVLSTKDYLNYVMVSSGLNINTNLECAQNGFAVYCTNGVDAVFKWDGTIRTKLDGSNGTPNIPRGSYITSFLNRLWLGHTAADSSSLDWGAVVSTGGAILAPDNFLAWPTLNHHSVGQGDGENLTALWVYRGQLQIGKTDSVYTEFGDRDSNFIDRLTVKQAGVSSNDSVVVLDGLTYYKGKRGVYAYDGAQSVRISDLIKPDIDGMQDAASAVRQSAWDTRADFLRGSFFETTATVSGDLLTLLPTLNYFPTAEKKIITIPIYNDPNPFPDFTLNSVTPSTGFIRVGVTSGTPESPLWGTWTKGERLYVRNISLGCTIDAGSIKITLKNLNSGVQSSGNIPAALFSTLDTVEEFFPQHPVFDYFEVFTGSFAIKFELNATTNTFVCTGANILRMKLNPATTGQYLSDVAVLPTTIGGYGLFDSARELNTGNLSFYLRSSTSAVNISTKIWTSISPGANISEPIINNFIQWATTMIAISSNSPPTIDNVTIGYIDGAGSALRPFSIDWNNEYWMTIATSPSTNTRLQYVKSWITNANPNAWNVLANMDIASFWKDSNTSLYGGSSSAGIIYRLDYGTNDNGMAIDAYYDTPQLILKGALFGGLEGNWMEEQLSEYWVDANAENGNTFRLGSSLDGGAYTFQTLDLSGTGRILKAFYTPNRYAKYFSWRFQNSQIDKQLGLNNFAVLYQPSRLR